MDVETAYHYSTSCDHLVQCEGRSYGWCYESLSKENNQYEKNLYCAVKLVCQKLSKHHAEFTPTMGMHLISPHSLDPFWNLGSLRKWEKRMDSNPASETLYTTQYTAAFLQYVDNEYFAKRRGLPVVTSETVPRYNLFASAMASRSGASSYDPSNLSSNDDGYLLPEIVAETTPGRSTCTARLYTAARLYFISMPDLQQN